MPYMKVVRVAALVISVTGTLCASQNAAFALDVDDLEEAMPRLRRELPVPALSRRIAQELPALRMADPREDLDDVVPPAMRGMRLPPRALIVVPIDLDD